VRPPTAIVFDLDGTLIDSAGDLQYAANEVLANFDCEPLSLHEFRTMFGDGVGALVARALAARDCVVPQGKARRLFFEYYRANLTRLTRPYPGAQEMLESLRRKGLKLAVCTNKPTDLTKAILERLALDGYFTRVLGGDSLPFLKPDRRVLLQTLTELDVPPASSLFAGDSEVDAATAAAAGVRFVLMTHGYHRGPVGDIPCSVALEDFQQLVEFLECGGRLEMGRRNGE
jgi:phosphoglycolate phosphatase